MCSEFHREGPSSQDQLILQKQSTLGQIQEEQSTDAYRISLPTAQPAITCSKLTIETLEQGVKYVQS